MKLRATIAFLMLATSGLATAAGTSAAADSQGSRPAADATGAEAAREWRARVHEKVSAADTDGNKSISRAEAQSGLPRLAEHFDKVDADRDGEASHDELRAHFARHRSHDHAARAAERFKAADADQSGALDLAEVQTGAPRLAEHFTTIDANGDGLLSREELQRKYERH